MIHAYNENDLLILQEKLGSIFEYAVINEKIEIDDFANKFVESYISKAFEINDYKYTFGKSSIELLAIILNKEPKYYEDMPIVTPEYWVGFVLAFVQWYYNISYKEIISAYPCKELIKEYFPYHEMDIRKVLDLFNIRLNIVSKLKLKREEAKLSQSELSIISNVPIRTIKAYEQQSIDISKGQIDTIYKLSKALHCKMEDLI